MNAQTTAKQTSKMSQIGKTRYMVQVAMLGAAAVVLMFFDIPLPFAPSFYKIDSGADRSLCDGTSCRSCD